MGLLAPWFLFGALAVGLPLWLHLMRRRNPVKLTFSSLMFFQKRTDTTIRERRLRYLLLLALRLAVLLLLALAFSKPVWERPPAVLGGRIPLLHLIAVDTSLSMGHGDRWEAAKEAADEIIEALAPGDRAQLLSNGPSVSVLTEPTADVAILRRALAGLAPTQASNSYGDVVEATRNLVEEGTGPARLHVISDLQHSAMPSRFQDLVLPPHTELVLHGVGSETDANWAVDSIKGDPRVYGREAATLEGTVASYAEREASKTVSLWINGQPSGSQRVEVPAWERVEFSFDIRDAPRGFSRAEVRIEPTDDLADDDVRRIAVDNSEPDPLLFVAQNANGRDVLYYRAALESSESSRYVLEVASPADLARIDPGAYAFIVLSDVVRLPERFEDRLRAWLEAGGALLVAIGPNSALVRRAPMTGHAVQQPLSSERGRAPFQLAGQADVTHPVAQATDGLRPVRFYLYGRISTQDGDSVPMRMANGDPLLIEHRIGRGRTLLFASALDNVWNNLPVTPTYVPFVVETARLLTGSERRRGEATFGDILELGSRRDRGGAVQVVDPSGEPVLTLSDSVEREALPLDSVGFYEIRGARGLELQAVNPDPRESNLRRAEGDALELWRSSAAEASGGLAAGLPEPEVPPWRVWRLLLVLLALAVLLESLIANRHLDALRGD
ncbi:MAG: BatA domain-containing protein [Bryobacterales bacterium]|nr:BatA domain-containing protein [Bryobacterales bacterium]